MGHIDTCLGILRRLIAKGDIKGVPLAERAINEYWDGDPYSSQRERTAVPAARRSGPAQCRARGSAQFCWGRERIYRKEAGDGV